MLSEFVQYLVDQIGQPYVWGGQHLKLTPDNYIKTIEKKEAGRGGYPDGTSYADAAIAYCKKKFDAGATVLYAYDCSGLGMYFLQNLKKIYKSDMNANRMMSKCELTETAPKKGYWVFRVSNGKATHIGYMVTDTELIESKGRKYGVTKTKFKSSAWSCWGIPECFKDEIIDPPVPPVPPEPPTPTKQYVEVIGRSVRVRAKDGILSKTLFIAHKGKTFELIDIAPSGWYHIMTTYPDAYITDKKKYTKLVEK